MSSPSTKDSSAKLVAPPDMASLLAGSSLDEYFAGEKDEDIEGGHSHSDLTDSFPSSELDLDDDMDPTQPSFNKSAVEADKIHVAAATLGHKYFKFLYQRYAAAGRNEEPTILTVAASVGNVELLRKFIEQGISCTKPVLNTLMLLIAAYPLEDVAEEMRELVQQAFLGCQNNSDSQFKPCIGCARDFAKAAAAPGRAKKSKE